jgi:hypothetical protein
MPASVFIVDTDEHIHSFLPWVNGLATAGPGRPLPHLARSDTSDHAGNDPRGGT